MPKRLKKAAADRWGFGSTDSGVMLITLILDGFFPKMLSTASFDFLDELFQKCV